MKWIAGMAIILILLLVQCARRPLSYQSLNPENSYTGIQSCQPCHQRVYDQYIQTGMGKSLYPPDPGRKIEQFGAQTVVYDPKHNFYYQAYWEEADMYIREFRLQKQDTVHLRSEKVDYVVGSGHQTRSYLMERNGYWYEMPITWYVNRQIWDLSPGYDVQNSRFDREIGEACLACHTGYIDYIEGSKNRYRFVSEGIDCEKCHGPGAIHIREMQSGREIDVGELIDYSIVNPAKLPLEAQFDICQQCHLQGINVPIKNQRETDFRPAMALDSVYAVFLEQDTQAAAFGIASHAERLKQSRCFIASAGKLSCTTCHNPHKSIAQTDSMVYVRQCQSCHDHEQQLHCGVEPALRADQSCISCHMPVGGTRDIPHVRFHDHLIRRPNQDSSLQLDRIRDFVRLRAAKPPVKDAVSGQAWLLHFEQQEADPQYLQFADSLLGNQDYYHRARLRYFQGRFAEAEQLSRLALKIQADEPLRLFLLAETLEAQQKYDDAYETFAAVYALQPMSVDAGLKTVVNLLRSQQGSASALVRAGKMLDTLHILQPQNVRVLANLGFVYLNQQNLKEAERYLVQALNLDPDHPQSLDNMVLLQILRNNSVLARSYLQHLQQVAPAYAGIPRLEQALSTL